ncbi:hypothetical protein, partial [Burkholderia ubonensis]|uniref:hypothetical protein n=1 Tax=Burkholderia ubonensis TaxID=101571 RepID=UPI001E4A0934
MAIPFHYTQGHLEKPRGRWHDCADVEGMRMLSRIGVKEPGMIGVMAPVEPGVKRIALYTSFAEFLRALLGSPWYKGFRA